MRALLAELELVPRGRWSRLGRAGVLLGTALVAAGGAVWLHHALEPSVAAADPQCIVSP
jgi:hypothetical protein